MVDDDDDDDDDADDDGENGVLRIMIEMMIIMC